MASNKSTYELLVHTNADDSVHLLNLSSIYSLYKEHKFRHHVYYNPTFEPYIRQLKSRQYSNDRCSPHILKHISFPSSPTLQLILLPFFCNKRITRDFYFVLLYDSVFLTSSFFQIRNTHYVCPVFLLHLFYFIRLKSQKSPAPLCSEIPSSWF
jgi:hypothetical protein